jgi:hypothetical protein
MIRALLLALVLFICRPLVGQEVSVLADGNWYKIGVRSNGVFRIDAQLLERLGLNPAGINPAHVRLFGNGGGMLPQPNGAFRYSDLVENALEQIGTGSRFDDQNYLLFYGQGPDVFYYDEEERFFHFQKNIYADTSYYFLKIEPSGAKRMSSLANLSGGGQLIASYDFIAAHEREQFNVLMSGRQWFGESFEINRSQTFNFEVAPLAGGRSKIFVQAMSRQLDTMQILVNGRNVGSVAFPLLIPTNYGRVGNIGSRMLELNHADLPASSSSISINLRFLATAGNLRAHLDHIMLQTETALQYRSRLLEFRATRSLDRSTATYQISGAESDLHLWDITNPLQPKKQAFQHSGNNISFTASSVFLKTFVLFHPNQAQRPDPIGPISHRAIKGRGNPDLIIVTAPAFREQADRLAAHRRSYNGYEVIVVTTQEVFNEFSSGKQDVTAIRDMARHFYLQPNSRFKYLLLFGTGSFDYKSRVSNNNNFVPTYQSVESLDPIRTYSSDDYFGFFDESKGEWSEDAALIAQNPHLLDIGVGRLPAQSVAHARHIVDKIVDYETHPATRTPWKNQITFVADDEVNSNVHVVFSEELASIVEAEANVFNINKIYVDAFEQEPRAAGKTSPQTNKALLNDIERGTLLINFIGHGNEDGWTDERIFTSSTIDLLSNRFRLPLFVTATCEFGRHDNPNFTSGAERLLTARERGAIAVLTTSRPVFNTTNQVLNRAFFLNVFQRDEDGRYPTLGEIYRNTKNQSIQNVLNRNFILLGDPSMKLAYPEPVVEVDGFFPYPDASSSIDTLNATQTVWMKGRVLSPAAEPMPDFNGKVFVTVFDQRSQRNTLGFQSNPMAFDLFDNAIHRGVATVRNGEFEMPLRVTQNIDYAWAEGRVSIYALHQNKQTEAAGYFRGFTVGGSQNGNVSQGAPRIQLFINDTTFVSGRRVNRNPRLIVRLEDDYGINISQRAIGRELIAELRGQGILETLVLNDDYQAMPDTYQRGEASRLLRNLPLGEYEVRVTAWNNINQASTEQIRFIITDTTALMIEELIAFPNPAREQTNLRFIHNRGGEDLQLWMDVFTMVGEKVYELSLSAEEAPADLKALQWDLRDRNGNKLQSGIYILKLTVRSSLDGAKNMASQKLVIIK